MASPRPTVAPFGSWASPITGEVLVQASVSLGGPAFAAGDLWWSELRPTEAGRVQIVRKGLAGAEVGHDVLPDGFSARTRVHEYGGGAWWLHTDTSAGPDGAATATLFFANWSDQRLHRIDRAGDADAGDPVAITPEPGEPNGFRFADGRVTADGRHLICVREAHGVPGSSEARNELVAVPADGSSDPVVLVGGAAGPDFVAAPRLSPDGTMLCWLQWQHPSMPWDRTELWVADVVVAGNGVSLERASLVAGAVEAPPESIAQPEWAPDGRLYFVSDRDGWWNLFAFPGGARPAAGTDRQLSELEMELAQPLWVFG